MYIVMIDSNLLHSCRIIIIIINLRMTIVDDDCEDDDDDDMMIGYQIDTITMITQVNRRSKYTEVRIINVYTSACTLAITIRGVEIIRGRFEYCDDKTIVYG